MKEISPKRQRRFLIKERRSEVRKIKTEMDEAREQAYQYVDAEVPIRDGWKREFVVRYPHIMSGQNAVARELLPILQSVAYCQRKDFIHKIYYPDGYRWYWGPVEQKLRHISKRQFESLRPDQQQFFRKLSPWEVSSATRWSRWWKFIMDPEYVFKKPYLFTLKVKKHFKTRVRVLDSEAESKYKKLHDKLYGTSDVYDHKAKLLNWNNENSHGKKWKYREQERVFGKEIKQEIQEVKKGGIDEQD